MTNKERFEKAVKAAKEKKYEKYFEGVRRVNIKRPDYKQFTKKRHGGF